MSSANYWLIGCGGALILLGVLIRWRTARYDLEDAAFDSAWTLLRGRRTAENPTALEVKFDEIRSRPTWTGKAAKAAGTAAGHFIAKALAVVALVAMLVGAALILVGIFWR